MLQPNPKDWTVEMLIKHFNTHGPNILDAFLVGMQGDYVTCRIDEIPGFTITAAVQKYRDSNLARANLERQEREDTQSSQSTHSTSHIMITAPQLPPRTLQGGPNSAAKQTHPEQTPGLSEHPGHTPSKRKYERPAPTVEKYVCF